VLILLNLESLLNNTNNHNRSYNIHNFNNEQKFVVENKTISNIEEDIIEEGKYNN